MHKNISEDRKLLVVSDTGIIKTAKGYRAFGPVVKELEHLLEIFNEIIWIGFEKNSQKNNNSYIEIKDRRIYPILLPEVGGKSFTDKIEIILNYPKMIRVIYKEVKKSKFIHSRAPSNPSVIVMVLSMIFTNKKFWHKYAGTWVDKASFFYKLQRFFLKKLYKNSSITINGNFSNKSNILPFENPCLNTDDRQKGNEIVKTKRIENKVNICFVGALNEGKGILELLDSLKRIKSNKINSIHIVGSGKDINKYKEKAKEISYNIIFHGYKPKNEIDKIYKDSHFIILPSKSEGFPKVIGEAMNYGCIPIVSDISCIGQYIIEGQNGFLIEKVTPINIIKKIEKALDLSSEEANKIIHVNYNLAEKFTYEYYNKRIKEEIFKI